MFANHPNIAKRWAKEYPHQGKLPEKVRKKAIKMSKSELVEEHRRLVKVLKHPTKKGLAREKKEQGSELKEYLKKKGYKWRVNNRMKGSYATTDLKNRTVTVNKKAHKNPRLRRVKKNRDGSESLLNTIEHEKLHIRHPKMHEKTVYKKALKDVKKMNKRMKKRLYDLLP